VAAENFKVKKGLEVGTAITATSSGVNVTGIVTATQFNGDGSGLTGVTGSGSGVIVKDEGSAVGTAGTINFVGSGVAATLSAGTATVTINSGGLSDIVSDTTPQLGGNLDLNSKFISGSGGINVSGVTTSTSFVGNITGNLTGNITGAVTVGGNITGPLLSISPGSGDDGIILLNSAGGQNNDFSRIRQVVSDDSFRIENKASGAYESLLRGTGGAGVKLYFAGNEKLTTTINGIEVPDLNVTGVGTVGRLDTSGVTLGTNSTTFAAKFADNAVANFGTDNDLKIYHDDGNGLTYIRQDGTGPLDIRSINDIHIRDGNDGDLFIKCEESEGVKLYYEGNEKLEVTNHGAIVTGVCTATSFSGSGAGLTNIPSAQLSGALPSLDGSALTGITASGSGVIVKHDGSTVGTAGTINFSTNLDVSAISAGIVTVTASGGGSNASTFTVTANNSTDETVYPIFVDGATGSQGAESDTNLYYNPNSNILTAGTFSGNLAGTVNTAAQTNITSLGTLSSLTVSGNITANGNVVGDNSTNISGIASVTATSFHGSGALLTSLDADNLGSGTIPNGRFPATLPATSGANLTALNASEITSGTLPIARVADNAVTFAKMQDVSTGVIIGRNDSGSGDIETLSASDVRTLLNVADGATAGITTSVDNVTGTWSVTANGSSAYRFTGPGQSGNEDDPNIYLVRGQRYSFINTTGSSHPFRFRVSSGGSTYTDGISGSESGTQYFNVQHDAPASLVYQCTVHSGMVGNIYIVGQHLANGANNRVLTATSAYGMNGEQNLTWDGTTLDVTGDITTTHNIVNTTANNKGLIINATGSNYPSVTGNAARTGADEFLLNIRGLWNDTTVANIILETGSDTTNKDDGVITFRTASAGSPAERLRIDSAGNMSLGKSAAASTNYGANFQIHDAGTSGATLHLTTSQTGSSNSDGFHLVQQGSHLYHWLRESGDQVFATAANERLRIASDGQVRAGDESGSNRTSYRHQFSSTAGAGDVLSLQNPSNSDGQGIGLGFWARNTNNAAIEVAKIKAVADETQANSTQKGSLRFLTNIGASMGERMQITSDGNLSISDGNLKLASGHGIDFSATSDSGNGTMGNELFDDYEEGSWTPSFNTANSSGTLGSLAYDVQEGRYVKIGSTVYIEGALRTTSVANNGGGTYDIAGLPFTNTSGGTSGVHGIIHCGSQHSWTNAPQSFDPIGSATYMRARGGINVGDSTYTNGATQDFNTSSGSNNRVYFSGTYSVDF